MSKLEIVEMRRYRARFEPTRTDDLRPGLLGLVGTAATFEAGWQFEEEDGGPYVGQWAMIAPLGWPCSWVPLCDLQDVQPVED